MMRASMPPRRPQWRRPHAGEARAGLDGRVLEPIGEFWNGFLSNPIVQLASQLIVIYVVLLWLGTAYWAFRDMQARTENPILPYFAAALIIFFTPAALPLRGRPVPDRAPARDARRGLRAQPGRGVAACRGREERALPGLPRSGRRRLARLPELPHPAPSGLPVLQPTGRAELAAVRLLRHRLRPRAEADALRGTVPGERPSSSLPMSSRRPTTDGRAAPAPAAPRTSDAGPTPVDPAGGPDHPPGCQPGRTRPRDPATVTMPRWPGPVPGDPRRVLAVRRAGVGAAMTRVPERRRSEPSTAGWPSSARSCSRPDSCTRDSAASHPALPAARALPRAWRAGARPPRAGPGVHHHRAVRGGRGGPAHGRGRAHLPRRGRAPRLDPGGHAAGQLVPRLPARALEALPSLPGRDPAGALRAGFGWGIPAWLGRDARLCRRGLGAGGRRLRGGAAGSRAGDRGGDPWLVVVAVVILAPIAEEIFFRGVVFNAWLREGGRRWAFLGSSALFALIHLSVVALVPIFLLGLALAWSTSELATCSRRSRCT